MGLIVLQYHLDRQGANAKLRDMKEGSIDAEGMSRKKKRSGGGGRKMGERARKID